MISLERPIIFDCDGDSLLGILHDTDTASRHAVLVVVGGPQYRVGSHRQFVLLARDVAAAGIPVFRFDYRGMGDSGGDLRDFEAIGVDIRSALDSLFDALPKIETVTLWGLCDAASAIAFYLEEANDARVRDAIVLNPWVHDDNTEAEMLVQDYYKSRATNAGEILKLIRQPARWPGAARGILGSVGQVLKNRLSKDTATSEATLAERVLGGLIDTPHSKLVLISGDDLTAREFLTAAKQSNAFDNALRHGKIKSATNRDADHTFSCKAWRDWVSERTIRWLESASS